MTAERDQAYLKLEEFRQYQVSEIEKKITKQEALTLIRYLVNYIV